MMLHLACLHRGGAVERLAHSVLTTAGRRYAHRLPASRQILSPYLPLVGLAAMGEVRPFVWGPPPRGKQRELTPTGVTTGLWTLCPAG